MIFGGSRRVMSFFFCRESMSVFVFYLKFSKRGFNRVIWRVCCVVFEVRVYGGFVFEFYLRSLKG